MTLLFLAACQSGTITLGDDTGRVGKDPVDTGDTDVDTDEPVDDTDTGTPDTDTGTPDTDTGGTDTDTGGTDTDTGGTDTGGTDTEEPDEPADCAPYGLVADEALVLASGATIDAYDATRGAWGGANSSADATVAVNEGDDCALSVSGTLSGDAWVAGDPTTDACLGWGGAVTGATSTLASVVPMPTVAIPSGLPASTGDKTTGWGETWELSADTTVDDLTLAYGSAMVVTTSLTLVVEGAFAADSATLTIAEGARLDLYVDGTLRVGWGAVLNGDGEPARLRIHALDDLTLDYGSALTAVVEQDGDFANNGGAFSGTWIGTSLTSAWGATYHVDTSRLCP